MSKQWLIKHAYEWFDDNFNCLLVNEAEGYGYRFIHLLRRDDAARLVSLHFERQGAWDRSATDRALQRARRDGSAEPLNVALLISWHLEAEKKKREIDRAMRKSMRGIKVWYEDLFTGTATSRLTSLCHIADFLEVDRKKVYRLQSRLQNGAQDTHRIYPHLPNLGELKAALRDRGFGA